MSNLALNVPNEFLILNTLFLIYKFNLAYVTKVT
jgi:hypothetical protein